MNNYIKYILIITILVSLTLFVITIKSNKKTIGENYKNNNYDNHEENNNEVKEHFTDLSLPNIKEYNDSIKQKYLKSVHLVSKKSKYQKIDIYYHDFVGYILVIDNDLQITTYDEKNYHEMITHVPLNYIEDAKNVLIIGAGDGGVATEVLKHKNIKNVYWIEIDEEVVKVCRIYFPHLHKHKNDKRLKLIHEDASKWIVNKDNIKKFTKFFDIAILDSTDFGASNQLLTVQFYKNIKKLMKDVSILAFNYTCLQWNDQIESNRDLTIVNRAYNMKSSNVFNNVSYYQIFQPSYISGHYSFAFCSDKINPTNTLINWNTWNKKNITTKYYNKKVHYSSFSLPNKLIVKKKKKKIGCTLLINIGEANSKSLNNLKKLNEYSTELLKLLKINEIGRIDHKFTPQGVTLLVLLSESHLGIHTWPEDGTAYIDLFSCGQKTQYNYHTQIKIEKLTKKYFNNQIFKIDQNDRAL